MFYYLGVKGLFAAKDSFEKVIGGSSNAILPNSFNVVSFSIVLTWLRIGVWTSLNFDAEASYLKFENVSPFSLPGTGMRLNPFVILPLFCTLLLGEKLMLLSAHCVLVCATDSLSMDLDFLIVSCLLVLPLFKLLFDYILMLAKFDFLPALNWDL